MTTPLKLLVVDDSAYNRRTIADVFARVPEVELVGKASDGEEALRLAALLQPDVITLDLEMPRMDGFTFLRILMSKQPTPVIVVSSYSQKENVFKALELGALDFVAKPTAQIQPDATDLRDQILEKVLMVRKLRRTLPPPLSRRTSEGRIALDVPLSSSAPAATPAVAPTKLVVVAASTGGPTALLDLFSKLPASSPAAVLIAQHMPDKFTRTFAERLGRRGAFQASEAQEGAVVQRRQGYVCPGRQCLSVLRHGADLRLALTAPTAEDRYAPSGDRLLASAARAFGSGVVGVVLTGMGDDGLAGARAVRDAGGIVLAESQETAVVYGMPGAVAAAGLANEVLPLPRLVERLAAL